MSKIVVSSNHRSSAGPVLAPCDDSEIYAEHGVCFSCYGLVEVFQQCYGLHYFAEGRKRIMDSAASI